IDDAGISSDAGDLSQAALLGGDEQAAKFRESECCESDQAPEDGGLGAKQATEAAIKGRGCARRCERQRRAAAWPRQESARAAGDDERVDGGRPGAIQNDSCEAREAIEGIHARARWTRAIDVDATVHEIAAGEHFEICAGVEVVGAR